MFLHKSFYTYSALSGVIVSLIFGFYIPLNYLWICICIVFLMTVFFILLLHLRSRNDQKNDEKHNMNLYVVLAIVFCIFFVFGLIRMDYVFKDKPKNHVVNFIGNYMDFEAKIVEEVDERITKIKYTVEVFKINGENASGRLLINASKYQLFEYGDVLHVKGIVIEAPEDETFSYKEYLSRYEIYGIIDKAQIKKMGSNPNSILLKKIFYFKKLFLQKINKVYSEPYASFLAGLLIGARKGLPKDIQMDFQITGLSHIVAVSGSNITMIMALVMTMLVFLPRLVSFAVSVVFVILFTIFVGMSAAVVRAAIMGIIGLIAVQSGRPKATLIALLVTVAVMGLWQPKMLIYDIGFQLSVSAVIGVIWLVPLLPDFFQKLPEQFAIKEAIALTIAAQITTLPVSIMNFHAFSLIAPIANLFVVPAIPFAMLFGFFSMLPIPILSDLSGFIAYFLLKVSLFFAHFFASIPYAQVSNIWVSDWWWVLYLVGLGVVFWWRRRI